MDDETQANLNWLQTKMSTTLGELLHKSREAYARMTPEERAEQTKMQIRSYVVAEAAMGSDADEAAYAAALDSGNISEINRLEYEANARESFALAYLKEQGY